MSVPSTQHCVRLSRHSGNVCKGTKGPVTTASEMAHEGSDQTTPKAETGEDCGRDCPGDVEWTVMGKIPGREDGLPCDKRRDMLTGIT